MNSFENVVVPIEKTFQDNVESVHKLIGFDNVLLDFCVARFSILEAELNRIGIGNGIGRNLRQKTSKSLDELKRIRQNESLRTQYADIFNQSLVLLVSYFGLSVRDLFKASFSYALASGKLDILGQHDIKITLADLQTDNEDFADRLADIFIAQKGISFQDSQSIARAFNDCFGFNPQKDRYVHNIILAQACRHIIVHSGSQVDAKLLKQVSNAKPRDIKQTLSIGEKVQFEPDEIKLVGESMINYLSQLGSSVKKSFK